MSMWRPPLRRFTGRIGELLTAGDVCHLHEDRAAADRCGVLLGGEPDAEARHRE